VAVCIAESKAQHEKKEVDLTEVAVPQKNLGLFQLRRAWRYGDMKEYQRGIDTLSSIVLMDKEQKRALDDAKASLVKWKATGFIPHDDARQSTPICR